MVPPDVSEYDAVVGVVRSTPTWYTIGTISRSAVCAGPTQDRVEWRPATPGDWALLSERIEE